MYTTVAPAVLAHQARRADSHQARAQAELPTLTQRALKRKLAKRTPAGIRQAVAVFTLVAVALLVLVTGTVTGRTPETTGALGGLLTLLGSTVACVLVP